MGSSAVFDGTASKTACQRVGYNLGSLLQARCVTVGEHPLQHQGAQWPTRVVNGLDRDQLEACLVQFCANHRDIVIAVQGASEERRWVVREKRCQCICYSVGEIVLRDAVLDVEKQTANGFQDATSLLISLNFVGKNITPNWHATTSNS